jgi:pyridoxal phosphate enzyme (YggS family)
MTKIAKNLDIINNDIDKICTKYQKNKNNVNLIAVSKTILADKIEEAIIWGCKDFGENRIQEAQDKWINLKIKYPDTKLHLIGHLQSKKVKNAVQLFDFIHSLDSLKLANILKLEMEKQERHLNIFIQVNIGSESSKTGVELEDVDDFINKVTSEIKLPIYGLMCIPPANEDSSTYFALLHKIATKYQIKHLSMGMSRDYSSAIAINSTYIRVGAAIFGDNG